MKKLLFLLFVLFFFPLAGQTYYITETQLETLETTLANYKASNQIQAQALRESQKKAESLAKSCENLTAQLKTERETTQNLSESLSRYENKVSQSEAEKFQALQDLEAQKVRTEKWKARFFVALSVLAVLLVISGAYIIIKLKKL